MVRKNAPSNTRAPIEVTVHDLPLYCSLPGTPIWAGHPRVFLDVVHSGDVVCPYCSAHYVLSGEVPKLH